jgi:hypothetical protein
LLALGAGSALLCAAQASAATMQYSDYVADVAVRIGSVSYTCTTTSDPGCAFVQIVATGDTSTVVPFSVPGAQGFENAVGSVVVHVFLNDGGSFDASLAPGQLFVSVDQTNGGAGFGSAFGPTYPAATYGGTADYQHFALASNFYAQGFSGFCPVGAPCDTGAALKTTTGDDLVISYPFRPNFSVFDAAVVAVPDPAAANLMLLAMAMFSLRPVGRQAGRRAGAAA